MNLASAARIKVQLSMERIILKLAEEPGTAPCPCCGEIVLWSRGPRMVASETDDTVCRRCAKRHAPNLLALIDLAHVAERVGKQSRHLLTPPMESLLDLARAAENYCSAPRLRARAG
jgi:hypothetical protein